MVRAHERMHMYKVNRVDAAWVKLKAKWRKRRNSASGEIAQEEQLPPKVEETPRLINHKNAKKNIFSSSSCKKFIGLYLGG
ncbi:hypothetical protein POVWA2_022990 [Plasmodium ovale wallikeri]|uniref:Uncharacterized protein n=1 Tax=Plasmodium ovale wallikeri TaxID=864142 RepID=A0A1A8YU44_PLAOA|nr:hypothetical protein POVWA1_023190 [Plasmodium ovale wallikeri]SBT35056.1 hypothetical protein POVWA2_022990 [Plasmodium ovale wallikeri]